MMKQRITLALAMTATLGLGLLAGSLLTPKASAEPKTTAPQPYVIQVPAPEAPPTDFFRRPTTPDYTTPTNYAAQYYQPARWQIVTIPVPGRTENMVFLLDSQTGDSFLLRADRYVDAGYSWERLDRGR